MNMTEIESLLKEVSIIQKKYDEIAAITGENFNIFSIMNMETDEVKTHSAIIGELLNPMGSHSQGSVFLDLFIDHLKNKFNDISHQYIKLDKFNNLVNERICERTISINNNWADVTGGRIDIILEDEKQICIIETKIDAINQDYQLIRYHNYAVKKNKLFYVFYLTKDGKSLDNEKEYLQNTYLEDKSLPDVHIEGFNFHYEKKDEYKQRLIENIGKSNIHQCLYYPISFEVDIKNWLEKCLEKTVSLPIIRETLLQYVNLIKKITNQTTNNKMSNEIVESMKGNVISSFEISKNIEPLKSNLYYEFMDCIKQYAFNNKMTINTDWEKKDAAFGLFLKPEAWKNSCFQICIIFESKNYRGLYVGVSYLPEINSEDKNKLRKKFKEYGFQENDWWIWKYTERCNWADDAEIWESVAKGVNSKECKEIVEKIEEVLKVCDSMQN